MEILQSVEFVPGVKWFESGMHDALFQHSVFGAIVFLVVSNTGVYKFVKDALFSVTGFKADGNTLQFIHAVVFAVIMYFGSMYLFAPLMTEGLPGSESSDEQKNKAPKDPDATVFLVPAAAAAAILLLVFSPITTEDINEFLLLPIRFLSWIWGKIDDHIIYPLVG